jgi:hypothetical protein
LVIVLPALTVGDKSERFRGNADTPTFDKAAGVTLLLRQVILF